MQTDNERVVSLVWLVRWPERKPEVLRGKTLEVEEKTNHNITHVSFQANKSIRVRSAGYKLPSCTSRYTQKSTRYPLRYLKISRLRILKTNWLILWMKGGELAKHSTHKSLKIT